MGSGNFLNGIEAARKRVEELRQRASGSSENVTAAALEELQIALEELQVADEEMRRQNEELLATRNALEGERRRYIDLFEAAPDAYVVTNPASVITEANIAAGLLCGVAPGYLAGKPLSVFVTGEKLEELLVREQQARADAEVANKSKDEFLATLGHELRTPLNAIVGWAHILNTKPRDENLVDRAIEVIKRNAVLQSQIVNDLLDVSRIIAGNLQLEFRDVSLSHIVEVVIEATQPIADAKSIQIDSILDSSGRMVSGDPVRLQQIVWNLVANAIHFTPPGGRIAVKLAHLDEVRLTITDTGDGIRPEFLPYVFDRFRQADGGSTRRHGGLGLGLSIVRRLGEMHGGNVLALSRGAGQGATFVVSLPFAEQAMDQAGSQ